MAGEDCRRLSNAKGEPRCGAGDGSRQVHGPTAFPDDSSPAYARQMAARRLNEPIEPMTLGNMRANGVRSLDVCCWICHHRAIMSADRWPDDVPMPTGRARSASAYSAFIVLRGLSNVGKLPVVQRCRAHLISFRQMGELGNNHGIFR